MQKIVLRSVQYYKALANVKRLAILKELQDSELSVGQLAKKLDSRQANISQHLRCLNTVRLVVKRRQGKYMYYHLASQNHFTPFLMISS